MSNEWLKILELMEATERAIKTQVACGQSFKQLMEQLK